MDTKDKFFAIQFFLLSLLIRLSLTFLVAIVFGYQYGFNMLMMFVGMSLVSTPLTYYVIENIMVNQKVVKLSDFIS